MTIGDHDEGFEKEARLREMHNQASQIQDALYKWGKFMEISRILNPELCEGAFSRRPCRRKLRYIGYDNWPEPTKSEMNAEGHDHFAHGEIYHSTDFNGATYGIKGYSNERKIGCAFFEWLVDEEVEKVRGLP